MIESNEKQQEIIDLTDGIVVVDAGPGTGKTATIVARYVNIVKKHGMLPKNILMLTFTDNAANEMERRIKEAMRENSKELADLSNDVRAKTFDSLCYSIVRENAEQVGRFFGMKERLTRSARIFSNKTVNERYFKRFYDGFLKDHGAHYGDIAVILSTDHKEVMEIIDRLMSKGIIPRLDGWFGIDCDRQLYGDTEAILKKLRDGNIPEGNSGSKTLKALKELKSTKSTLYCNFPETSRNDKTVRDDLLVEAVSEDNSKLIDFIHDVYYYYIRKSISDNRLTFGLNAIFAFTLLYSNPMIRKMNRYEYITIDEFQDTNAAQLMIALMIMNAPNLCAVGDWKQGIYGFRYVSIENITEFEERAKKLKAFLNEDEERVSFDVTPIEKELDQNYRSSKVIIDESFKVLDYYEPDEKRMSKVPVRIREAARDSVFESTHVRYVKAIGTDEVTEVVKRIRDYVSPGRYPVNEDEGKRRDMRYSDIAVLCLLNEQCRSVMAALQAEGIPAFLQGDVDIMSTPEGKLALAWLRFINNKTDPNGFIPIMVFEGYSLSELKIAKGKHEGDVHIEGIIPPSLLEQREKLYRKKRRVTEMLTMLFAYYGGKLDQDIVQSIIAVLSSEHRSSLLTISDMIDLIQTDIENRTAYPVEVPIGKDAVRIMTIHKSKGMQFRTVIIPFMDGGLMPKDEKRHPSLRYDESYGIRCAHEIGHFGDYEKICHNWRSKLVMRVKDLDRNEYKRLLFVAMTRAEQYLTLISMDGNVSEYIEYMAADGWAEPVGESEPYVVTVSIPSSKPSVGDYVPRRENLGVHDIMCLDFSGSDEVGGKGMEYGTQIHQDAQMLFYGREPKDEMPEHPRIREILDSVKDADLRYSEIEMKLPISKYNAILKGYIDLMAVYPDRVEIIDYKTDAERSDKVEKEYMLQLSVYAHAASGYYNTKEVRCRIEYVSLGESIGFGPVPISEIEERVKEVLSK